MSKGFYLGNELIALAAKNAGVTSAYAYPGTPSSEILSAFQTYSPEAYSQWALNEKLALELASAAAISGSIALCCMKQVGLNVAADPLFSVAYTGVNGALVLVSADDPGPHSSQTEQDSRLYAYSAKIPVLDLATPEDAYHLTLKAFEISHKFSIPVIIRPVMRVCHSRRSFDVPDETLDIPVTKFTKDPSRFAATPKFRAELHRVLIKKLDEIAEQYAPTINKKNKYAIVASGYPYAAAYDIKHTFEGKADLIKIDMPHPISKDFIRQLEESYEKILVLEETFPMLENEFNESNKVYGKRNNTVISAGEFTIDECKKSIAIFLGEQPEVTEVYAVNNIKPPAKPRLCAGCGHRPAFYAIKRAAPRGIYAGDIGCYTLGTNLKAVDTCICMGASITFAESLKRENPDKHVVCTIGDSTFFHTGVPALINAKLYDAPIVVALLDNATTAMTGFQPVPHEMGKITLENVIKGIGVDFVKIINPYNVKESVVLLKEAIAYAEENNTPAVVIFRQPCITKTKQRADKIVTINEKCTACGICFEMFECPALSEENGKVIVNEVACIGCMACIEICPCNAIEESK